MSPETPLYLIGGLTIATVIALTITAILLIIRNIRRERKNRALLNTVTPSYRGTWSERQLVLNLLKQGIPSSNIFHDLYVEKYSGYYSQIDAAVVTKAGIIVFEVKDYSGWIFGRGDQTNWTQILAYGREKYRFYNPVKQNEGHIYTLKKRLAPYADVPFYSVIVFYGDCILKDLGSIPYGTFVIRPSMITNCIHSIINGNPSVCYKDIYGVITTLKEAVNNGSDRAIQIRHLINIKNKIGNNR